MHPVLIDFGIFKLHTYGLMIALGFMVGMQLGVREARRIDTSEARKFDQFILDLTFWILIAAMVGARLLFIIVEWESDYTRDPLKIFRIWEGGLVFYGGLIGSILFSVYYCWRKKRDFWVVADVLIPSVALGQFFGRIGCFAAGCCWGGEVDSDFPLSVQFPAKSLAYSSMQRAGAIASDALYTHPVHPVQLYESAGALLLFFALLYLRTKKRFHGQVLIAYMLAYPILRSSLEMLRGDTARGVHSIFGSFSLSTGQIVSILVVITAVILFFKRKTSSQPRREDAHPHP